jgi:hypothetical protein
LSCCETFGSASRVSHDDVGWAAEVRSVVNLIEGE